MWDTGKNCFKGIIICPPFLLNVALSANIVVQVLRIVNYAESNVQIGGKWDAAEKNRLTQGLITPQSNIISSQSITNQIHMIVGYVGSFHFHIFTTSVVFLHTKVNVRASQEYSEVDIL